MKPVSELLKQSLQIYKKYFGLLAGYAAWMLLPYAGIVLVSLPQDNTLLYVLSLFFSLAQSLLALWLGIFIPLVVRELVVDNKKIPFSILQNKAWQIIPSVVFVAILEAAVFLGGLILLIIPGLIFWVWFAMAQLTVVLSDKKGLEAMASSRELSRERFWQMAWRLVAGPSTIFIIIMLVTSILISVIAILTGISVDTLLGDNPPLWSEIIYTIIETFSMPIILVYFTLLYLDLATVLPPPQPSPTAAVKEGE
jgi:hypothetical protein